MLPRVPFPLYDGGAIAMYNLVKGLKENGAEITVLAYNTIKHYNDPIPNEILSLGDVHTIFIDNRVKPLGALKNLFSSASYNIERFVNLEVEQKLIQLLTVNTYDIIHFDSLYTGIYLPKVKEHLGEHTKTVLRQHNIEYQIWKRIAEGAKPLKKAYLNMLASRLKREEEELLPQFDAIIPITDVDAHCFSKLKVKRQHVCPVGVNMDKYSGAQLPKAKTVFHLGSLDWMPNLEGMEWFLKSVWPLVVKECKEAHFHIAGRNVPDWIAQQDGMNNVIVDGEIPDAPEYLNSKSIMVVPLMSGSGMRVKIIEGFAAGKAIVSTSIGAEGIKYTDGKDILIADDATKFSKHIIDLLKDDVKVADVGANARTLANDQYSDVATAAALMTFYKELVSDG